MDATLLMFKQAKAELGQAQVQLRLMLKLMIFSNTCDAERDSLKLKSDSFIWLNKKIYKDFIDILYNKHFNFMKAHLFNEYSSMWGVFFNMMKSIILWNIYHQDKIL